MLDGWRKTLDSISDGYENFRIKQPCGENSEYTPYMLIVLWHFQNILIKRKHFRFVRIDDSSEELVGLCLECAEYLTNHEKREGVLKMYGHHFYGNY